MNGDAAATPDDSCADREACNKTVNNEIVAEATAIICGGLASPVRLATRQKLRVRALP
jgi:hypothetical protein